MRMTQRRLIHTVRQFVEHEIEKRKGSRFIAAVYPLVNVSQQESEAGAQGQVKELLDDRRAKFPQANHHCFAYTTQDGREICSDDGEPHGTAGKPILNVLQRAELSDVCIVVTRIFGGVELGKGGLIRAYGSAAQEAIAASEIVELLPTVQMKLDTPFEYINVIEQACAKFQGEILEQDFSDASATYVVSLPETEQTTISEFLSNKSSGSINIQQQ